MGEALQQPSGRLPEEGATLRQPKLDVEERKQAGMPERLPAAAAIEVGERHQEVGGGSALLGEHGGEGVAEVPGSGESKGGSRHGRVLHDEILSRDFRASPNARIRRLGRASRRGLATPPAPSNPLQRGAGTAWRRFLRDFTDRVQIRLETRQALIAFNPNRDNGIEPSSRPRWRPPPRCGEVTSGGGFRRSDRAVPPAGPSGRSVGEPGRGPSRPDEFVRPAALPLNENPLKRIAVAMLIAATEVVLSGPAKGNAKR
jgi:hypothetical protein